MTAQNLFVWRKISGFELKSGANVPDKHTALQNEKENKKHSWIRLFPPFHTAGSLTRHCPCLCRCVNYVCAHVHTEADAAGHILCTRCPDSLSVTVRLNYGPQMGVKASNMLGRCHRDSSEKKKLNTFSTQLASV